MINDGSTDRTVRVTEKWMKKYPQIRLVNHDKNRGYGASLRTGYDSAQYEWVFFTDGDQQFHLNQLADFLPYTDKYRVIIGYRKSRAEGAKRNFNAKLFRLYIDLLFRLHVKDIDCAFKLIHRSALEKIKLESNGAFISSELLYKLKKKRYSFKQLPVDHYPRKFGKPTGANWRVIVKAGVESLKLYLHMKLGLFSQSKF